MKEVLGEVTNILWERSDLGSNKSYSEYQGNSGALSKTWAKEPNKKRLRRQ